jgi:hypothetical protein
MAGVALAWVAGQCDAGLRFIGCVDAQHAHNSDEEKHMALPAQKGKGTGKASGNFRSPGTRKAGSGKMSPSGSGRVMAAKGGGFTKSGQQMGGAFRNQC